MKKILSVSFCILNLLLTGILPATAVSVRNDTWTTVRSTQGTDFWLTYMLNAGVKIEGQTNHILQLHATTEAEQATVTVNIGYWNYSFEVKKDSVATFTVPNDRREYAYIYNDQVGSNNGVHVTSTQPISLYSSNYGSLSYEASFVLPTPALGTEYIVQSFSKDRYATEFTVIATEDWTDLNIFPTATTTLDNSKDNPITVRNLRRGQVYLVRSEGGDLSGTTIYSNKNIAVICGNQSTTVPYNSSLRDTHIYEQAVPIRFFGTSFAVTTVAYSNYHIARVTALYPDTKVFINGDLKKTLQRSESYETRVSGSAWITTSRPAACYTYLTSSLWNEDYVLPNGETDQYGDPAMVCITPVEQGLNSLVFSGFTVIDPDSATEAQRQTKPMIHYVNVVTQTSAVSTLYLDNQPQTALFQPLAGNNEYSFARIPISSQASHQLVQRNRNASFTAYVYGLGSAESYAYNAGFNNRYNNWYTYVGGGGGSGGSGGAGGGGGSGSGGGSGLPSRDPKRLDNIQICISEDSLTFASVKVADCEKISWDFGDGTYLTTSDSIVKHKYTTVGTYHATMIVEHESATYPGKTVYDSVYVNVEVVDTYRKEFTVRLCQGTNYYFHGEDSIYTNLLEPNRMYTYVDSSVNIAGCDSITTLHLYVGVPDTAYLEATVCPAQLPYTDDRVQDIPSLRDLTKDSVYSAVTTCNLSPCDSVIFFTLHIEQLFEFTGKDTACQYSTFAFNDTIGHNVYRDDSLLSTIPTDSVGWLNLLANNGCDSIWNMSLYVAPVHSFFDSLRVCDNDTVSWHNRLYKGYKFNAPVTQHFDTIITVPAGILDDTLAFLTQDCHCDSTYFLHLAVQSTDTIFRQIDICNTEDVLFYDSVYSFIEIDKDSTVILSGSKVSTLGCDSIVKLTLNVHPTYTYTTVDTIFQKEPYTWTGHEGHLLYAENGMVNPISTAEAGDFKWIDSLSSQYGCDSVHVLSLFVAPVYNLHTDFHICDNDTVSWQNILYAGNKFTEGFDTLAFDGFDVRSSGTYFDTIPYTTIYGSDSIFTLALDVYRTIDTVVYTTICDNEPFTFADSVYDFSSWHKDTTIILQGAFQTIVGCDSLVELHLTIHQSYLFISDTTVCSNEYLSWRGKDSLNHMPSGPYYDRFTTQYGCDSVYQLNLTILPSFSNTEVVQLCKNDTVQFHGYPVYYDWTIDEIFQREYYEVRYGFGIGCDSIFRLEPHWKPYYHYSDTIVKCQYDTVLWRGKELVDSGIYYDSLKTHDCGCDSIYECVIKIDSVYLFETTDTICSNETYFWRDSLYEFALDDVGPHTYYERYATEKEGCDSTYMLRLYVKQAWRNQYDTLSMCENDTVVWHNRLFAGPKYHQPTDYAQYDTAYVMDSAGQYDIQLSFPTIEGCDSIFALHLSVLRADSTLIEANYCNDETVEFYDQSLDLSTFLSDTVISLYQSLRNVVDCDSVVELRMHIHPTYNNISFDTTCIDSTHYIWKQHEKRVLYMGDSAISRIDIHTAGTYIYTDSMVTAYGCDSIWKLHLWVDPTYHFVEEDTICSNQIPYIWRGKLLDKTGVYWDSLSTNLMYDSIYQLKLTVLPSYFRSRHIDLCERDSFVMSDRVIYNPGTYVDSLTASNGCDSVIEYSLTFIPAFLQTEYLELCEGSVLTYRGKQILEPGIYYDTLYTTTGCDSVFKIVVNKAATYYYESYAQIEKGGTYDFRGRLLTEAGVYYDSLRTVSGCDSIFKLTLNENPVYYYEDSVSVCESDLPYEFHDRLLYKGGVYYDSLSTQIGSDSIYRLVLTILPSYEQYNIVDLCDGDSVWFGGKYLYNPGIYSDTLKTRMGCDSIFHLTVNRAKSYHFRDSIALPIGESYAFHGQTIRTSGTYYDYQKTYQGCDSIYEQVVMFYPTYRFIEKDTICSSGSPYEFHGRSYYESGVYYDSLHTTTGFDSIYELQLTVLPSYLKTEYLELCEGTVLTHRGRQIYEQGIYYDTLFTQLGCDSVFKIVVNKAATYYYESYAQIEKGGTYDFRGRLLTEAGVYYDSLRTVSGCDSIFKLTLNLNPVYYYEDSVSVCESDLPYEFHDRLLYKGGVYYDSLSTQIGSDSIYRLVLTILPSYEQYNIVDLCDGDSVWFGGKYLYNPGIYSDTLKTRLGCDSIFHLTVNRAKSYYFRDSIALPIGESYAFHGQTIRTSGTYYDYQKTYQGCDSIYEQVVMFYPTYRFIEKDTICSSGLPYKFHGQSYYESGVYYEHLHPATGFDSIYELHLTVLPSYLKTEYLELCEGTVLTHRGRQIYKPGIYYDTLFTATGCDSICKIVVNYEPKYLFTIQDSIADGSTYNFRGKIISKPGIYFDSLQTVHGCDSVYQLILSKKSTKYVYTREKICQCKTPYVFFGQNIYQSGSYYYFRNDTTYQLDLTINPDYEIVDYLEICEGSVLTFRGKTILEQGIYYDSLLTKQGCDSIYKIIVNRAASYMVDIEKSICRGSYYKFGGELLTEQGVYYDTVSARTTSCDSIIRLVLTVREPDSIVTYDTICEYDTYIFNGRPINKSGVYNVHSYNSGGCDSTQILYLTVLPTKYVNDTVYLCKGEVYNFGGRILNSFGDYIDTICGTNQSIITRLHLAEVEPANLQTIQPISVCSDSKNFSINLLYDNNGVKPNYYTITFNTAASKIGFKDIYDQPLDNDYITNVSST